MEKRDTFDEARFKVDAARYPRLSHLFQTLAKLSECCVDSSCRRKAYLVGSGICYLVGQLSEMTAKVDEKGRVVIPLKIRRHLNIKNIVKISVKGREITLKPVEDPLKTLNELVVKGTTDVEREIRRLRRAAESELEKKD